MTTEFTIDEIKKDTHELSKIAIEDNISKVGVLNMFHPHQNDAADCGMIGFLQSILLRSGAKNG